MSTKTVIIGILTIVFFVHTALWVTWSSPQSGQQSAQVERQSSAQAGQQSTQVERQMWEYKMAHFSREDYMNMDERMEKLGDEDNIRCVPTNRIEPAEWQELEKEGVQGENAQYLIAEL